MRYASPKARLLAKTVKTDSCWLWSGYKTARGYGKLEVSGRRILVHRLAYALFVGEIPKDLTVDHSRCVRHCVNPEHLSVVTLAENARLAWVRNPFAPRGRKAKATQCKAGHPFVDGSFYVRKDKDGYRFRVCKECEKRRDAIRKRLRKLATG